MKENITALWYVVVALFVALFIDFYMTCELFHRFSVHVEETENVQHPSLEEMLGNTHQVYITIQTEQKYDTCTVQKSK